MARKRKTRTYKAVNAEIREIVKRAFDNLFSAADNEKDMANRYVKVAKSLSKRFKVKIPKIYRMRFCKHCGNYFIPGENIRVRTKNNKLVYYCLNCRRHTRFPFYKEKRMENG
jgi:ribonuclease P protein subunit RPR2